MSGALAIIGAVGYELALACLRPKQAFVFELRGSEFDQPGGMRRQLCELLRSQCVPIFFVFPRPDDFYSWHFVFPFLVGWFAQSGHKADCRNAVAGMSLKAHAETKPRDLVCD
jgi:hypothetical protein